MKRVQALLIVLLCVVSILDVYAQRGSGVDAPGEGFTPDAIYEIRYWTNMANPYDSQVYIDTMKFFGNERASFEYSNSNCISYHCRSSDSLVYVQLPNLMREREFIMGDNFLRRMYSVNVNFRGRDRNIYKVFVSDLDTKDSGIGDYCFATRQFGIIYRWNSDGEIFMLNRIDVVRDGVTQDEINLLPLQEELGRSSIFSGLE